MTERFGLPDEALLAETAWELLAQRVAATPDAPFARDESGASLSFTAYAERAERVAAGLSARGIGVGTPVSWILPTTLDALVLCAALCRLGAVQNPILPIYREREVAFATRQTGAEWLFVPSQWRGFDYQAMGRTLEASQSGLRVVCVDAGLPEAEPATLDPFAPPGDDPVRWHFYTSGTTSEPKGARHSDRTLLPQAAALVRCLALRPDDRHGFVFPFTHVGGVGEREHEPVSIVGAQRQAAHQGRRLRKQRPVAVTRSLGLGGRARGVEVPAHRIVGGRLEGGERPGRGLREALVHADHL